MPSSDLCLYKQVNTPYTYTHSYRNKIVLKFNHHNGNCYKIRNSLASKVTKGPQQISEMLKYIS